jgi:hypothetical protein
MKFRLQVVHSESESGSKDEIFKKFTMVRDQALSFSFDDL